MYEEIQAKCQKQDLKGVNVVVQIQSYGRVFVFDQLGLVVEKDQAICIFPNEDTIEDRIFNGLQAFSQCIDKRK